MPKSFFSFKVNPWGLISAIAALTCLVSVIALGGRHFWLFDITTHFRAQYALILILASLAYIPARKFKQAIVAMVFAAMNVYFIFPLYLGPASEAPLVESKTLRAIALNVRTENKEVDKVISFIRTSKADFLFVEEVDASWLQELRKLKGEYPHILSYPRDDNFGMALLSRIPFHNAEIKFFGGTEAPAAVVHMDIGQGLTVIGVHLVPPGSADLFALRNRQLADISAYVVSLKRQVMILGDLNMTSWSPFFKDFLIESGLNDSRKGFGIQPTWPTNNAALWIPIDHCLVSRGIVVRDRRLGPKLGSDHYPVILDFAMVGERP